ncbi:MAG TPA: AzlD domain-containing protein [Syntrophaceticus sp.]|jgi:branched-subunit amino acid transport protein|uniref:Predicted membrane protein n=1 Tax=Syntrophaceticus schinkii TaxID=499207 RepID=A0A0B7MES5_9FIRM|nr:AzlD domain-containing protein [Syntrophaceticus schinkii]HHY29904.1 AzlD domain-containing protein [Syntrophaceticus sp.]MDD2359277.1 AzlD domain-containing protein [Syntrophaceticus schinkii]MDD4261157.1 AzlD domain-containing protein [Syntrophaceticus schinkii]MDD4675449.1 AzlD domain-containing protein [Syntrophaceticus schinkii]CEO88575.1 Predicted membrane protein [Syntrophaceticus schinkii]
MDNTSIWVMIIGVSIVSLTPRIFPVAFFSRYEFPAIVKEWLSFVAPAVLGGLTALSILAPQGKIDISIQNIYIWAFIPTIVVAVKFKNLFITLLVGIVTMAFLYNFLGL